LEIPYAENLLPDDEDDWDEDPTLSEKRTEPLRPGDVVTYRALIFVAGDDRGKRTATVLNTDPDRSPMITLSNGDILPNDQEVKRIEVLENGKLVPHPYGYYRPIESFRITKAGSGGVVAGFKHEARRVGRIIDKNMHRMQKKAEADNFAPMDMLFNFRREPAKTPTRNAVSASDAADAPSESIESFSDDDFEMGTTIAAAATSAVTPRGRRTKQVPTRRRNNSDSESLVLDNDDYAKLKTTAKGQSKPRSANKGVSKSKTLDDSSDSESSTGLTQKKGDKRRALAKQDDDSDMSSVSSNNGSPGPRAAPLPLKRNHHEGSGSCGSRRHRSGRHKLNDERKATRNSLSILWKHSKNDKGSAFDQSADGSDDSVDLGTAAFAGMTDHKGNSPPSAHKSNLRKGTQLDKSSQHNSVDLSGDASDDLGDAIFAGARDRSTGTGSSSRRSKAKKTPQVNDSSDDDDDKSLEDDVNFDTTEKGRFHRGLQQGLAEIDAAGTPGAKCASTNRAAKARGTSLLRTNSSDEDEDLTADLPASTMKGTSRLESLNKGLAEIDAAGTPSAKTASRSVSDARKPSSSSETKGAASLCFTKQNRVSPRPVRDISAKTSTSLTKEVAKSVGKVGKSKASTASHSLSKTGPKEKRVTKTDPYAFESDDAGDSNEGPVRVIEVREKLPGNQRSRRGRQQKGQEQKTKTTNADVLLLSSDDDLEPHKIQMLKTPKGESFTSGSHLTDSDDDLGGSARPFKQMKRLSRSANKPSASKENASFTTPNLPLDWEMPTTGSMKKNRKTYSSRSSSKRRSKS
jgi:hypothetical protein